MCTITFYDECSRRVFPGETHPPVRILRSAAASFATILFERLLSEVLFSFLADKMLQLFFKRHILSGVTLDLSPEVVPIRLYAPPYLNPDFIGK